MLAQKNRKLKIGLDDKNSIHLKVLIKQETEITLIISIIYKLLYQFFPLRNPKPRKYMYQKFSSISMTIPTIKTKEHGYSMDYLKFSPLDRYLIEFHTSLTRWSLERVAQCVLIKQR